MTVIREGDTIWHAPNIEAVEKTVNFLTIESERITAEIHEVMWQKGYTFVGPTTEVVDNLYHSTFRKTH